jgi:hypothetical protein
MSDQKVLNPLPGTKLCSQPEGLFAAATPCLRGLVWVAIFSGELSDMVVGRFVLEAALFDIAE